MAATSTATTPLSKHRRHVEAQLAAGLAGTPLAPLAPLIERESWRQNVSPFLVAAIAGAESTFGRYACGGNAWGIGSCTRSFPSFADGVRYEAQLLRHGYIDRGLTTVWAIGPVYAPPSPGWPGTVAGFMTGRFGASTAVTYP